LEGQRHNLPIKTSKNSQERTGGLEVEFLPSMYKTLGSTSGTLQTKQKPRSLNPKSFKYAARGENHHPRVLTPGCTSESSGEILKISVPGLAARDAD
jgi:hypothetical protein